MPSLQVVKGTSWDLTSSLDRWLVGILLVEFFNLLLQESLHLGENQQGGAVQIFNNELLLLLRECRFRRSSGEQEKVSCLASDTYLIEMFDEFF